MHITTLAIRTGRFVAFFILAVMLLPPCVGLALTSDQQQVIQVTMSAVHARFPNTTDTPNVSQMAVVGSYALTTWSLGQGGGQAVLQKKSNGTWSVLGIGGGQMDSNILAAFGVPGATATSLLTNLGPVPTPTP